MEEKKITKLVTEPGFKLRQSDTEFMLLIIVWPLHAKTLFLRP